MIQPARSLKITPTHLERKAIIYIRQSSPKQVRLNTESQRNQRTLVERAQSLGWSQARIVVLDADLRNRRPAKKAEMTLRNLPQMWPWAMSASSLAGKCPG